MNRFLLILKHRWRDLSDTRRALPDDAAERLSQRTAASEARHTGEVRIVVEGGLPLSYLWRVGPGLSVAGATRQRALSWFGRLRIWDTEHNNGVLIYLLLAERRVEVLADRGLTRHVGAAQWQAMVDRLEQRLRAQAFEDGLTEALGEVSALLVQHFPAGTDQTRPNQLSNTVVRC